MSVVPYESMACLFYEAKKNDVHAPAVLHKLYRLHCLAFELSTLRLRASRT